jgi:hypothetical protein
LLPFTPISSDLVFGMSLFQNIENWPILSTQAAPAFQSLADALQALKNALQDPRFHDRLTRLDRAIYNLDYKKSKPVASQLIQEFKDRGRKE